MTWQERFDKKWHQWCHCIRCDQTNYNAENIKDFISEERQRVLEQAIDKVNKIKFVSNSMDLCTVNIDDVIKVLQDMEKV